jgi:hypothetical protein
VTQDTYAKPRSGGKALKPTPFGGVQAAEQRRGRNGPIHIHTHTHYK